MTEQKSNNEDLTKQIKSVQELENKNKTTLTEENKKLNEVLFQHIFFLFISIILIIIQ